MIVLDASAAVLGLLNDGVGRRALADQVVAVPHLIDAELVQALRAQVRRDKVGVEDAERALQRWARLGVRRYPSVGLLPRIWELRHNVTAYDGSYVALAEALGCELLTADARLAAAPTICCPVTVVRR